ncbi:MAG TPA: hypothetical protein VJ483_09820, partial [Holophagaceae bacterium]|nr:hypothetical protein [Holophagaceae bacterium]
AAAAKAAGQDKGFPSYEEVGKNPQLRAALVQRCQQGQSAEAQQRLQAEIKSAVPVTFGEGYQGAE